MKIVKVILSCFFVFGISISMNAQLWEKLKKKVETRVEEKINNEADKVIDNALDGKKNEETTKIEQSTDLPKLVGGSGILKLYNYGYEYVTKDIGISVYGKFTKENLSNSVKKYNQNRIIKPVDAYPEGYALAFNGGGFLNPKVGQIIIHHADDKKVVFSLKGTWNTIDGNKPIAGSYVSLNVTNVIDKRTIDSSNQISKTTIIKNASNKSPEPSLKKSTNNSSIKIPSTFSFSSSLEVKMTSGDGSSANLEFLLGNYANIYAMSIASAEMGEEGKVYNVITPKSITMFMDVAGMKMKKTVPQQQFSQTSFADKVPSNPDDLQKTGATKSILGFMCKEYKHLNDGGYVSVWATKDFPASATNITMLGMREGGIIEGFVLEIDMKSNNETANMKAVKFNTNKNIIINTNEYKSMGF